MSSFLPYARQCIDEAAVAEVGAVLRSDIVTRGPKVEEFERAVADYCGADYGVAFNSGTSALLAACYAARVSAYDRVITTPNTFVATVGAAMRFSARPVFVDIDASTGNLDIDQVQDATEWHSSRGRPIVVPVHFAGVPVDMRRLSQGIKNPDVVIIEDAAHALGSCYDDGKRVGCCAWSDMTVFSFHPAKNITTGEGGMVMTNDPAFVERLRHFRNNGIERDPARLVGQAAPWYYEVVDLTGNYNFTDFQAALGLCQLRQLDKFVDKRQRILDWYRERLGDCSGVTMLAAQVDRRVAYHLCVVRIDFETLEKTRTDVVEHLKAQGIGTQVHYIPVYRHPYFVQHYPCQAENFPNMEAYFCQALTLPLFYELEEDDVDRVCLALRQALE